jgi:spermidine/putrescine transport system permease protein
MTAATAKPTANPATGAAAVGAVPGRRRRRRVKNLGARLFLVLLAAFLFLPLFVVILFSFNQSASLSFPIGGFSLRWYNKVLDDPEVTSAIGRSAIAAFTTGLVAGTLGILAALGLQGLSPRWRGVVQTIVLVPIATPALLLAIGLAIYFNRLGVKPPRLPMAIAGHILLALPFVLLTMTAALDRFRFSLLEAARDLGASRARAFWTITFPLVMPAVLGAVLLAAAVSIDEFIIAFFTTGTDATLPLVIYARIRRVIDPGLNALATILLVATTLLAVLAARTTVSSSRR